ncbi:MAG: hypothetical protein PHD13_02900 [Methanocellales archaeon]|nr:hypothetical protein [Methanocellales archaeon]MDD3291757.1 hypothetical protein [Methanocellales archaeon]MDD5235107.1 hypothetical protein [Methanocellales archaeon]MDD5485245.1 hypothetical protein [Methanocellales archaeon]
MKNILDELGINAEVEELIGLARINVTWHYSDSSARHNVSKLLSWRSQIRSIRIHALLIYKK